MRLLTLMKIPHTRLRFRIPPAFFGLLAVFVLAASLFAADASAPAPAPAPASGDNTAPAETRTETTHLNVFKLYMAGGYFMIPLTLCSVLAIAIIIERFSALRRDVVIPADFLPGLKQVW